MGADFNFLSISRQKTGPPILRRPSLAVFGRFFPNPSRSTDPSGASARQKATEEEEPQGFVIPQALSSTESIRAEGRGRGEGRAWLFRFSCQLRRILKSGVSFWTRSQVRSWVAPENGTGDKRARNLAFLQGEVRNSVGLPTFDRLGKSSKLPCYIPIPSWV